MYLYNNVNTNLYLHSLTARSPAHSIYSYELNIIKATVR